MLRHNLKQKIKLILLCLASVIVLAQPGMILADVNAPGGGGNGIQNPLGQNTTFVILLTNVISFILGLVGVLALLAIIIGGVYIILGFANEDNVKQGKNIIKWAIIGLVVVLISYAIIYTIDLNL